MLEGHVLPKLPVVVVYSLRERWAGIWGHLRSLASSSGPQWCRMYSIKEKALEGLRGTLSCTCSSHGS